MKSLNITEAKAHFSELVEQVAIHNLLVNLTAINIKTIVVEEISTEEFQPQRVYQEIYQISRSPLQPQQLSMGAPRSGSLRDRYLALRQQLESEYALITGDDNSTLPTPDEFSQSPSLQKNPQLLAKLQQLSIQKTILDNNQTIYAQTTIELEGNITNRYSNNILQHPQKEVILDLHSRGVKAASQQWIKIIWLIIKLGF